jgi:hypothetical protein
MKLSENSKLNQEQAMANYDSAEAVFDSGLFYDAPDLPQPRKRMAQISLNLSKLSIAELIQSANNIKTAMTGNATFTTPNPSLANIGSLITNLTNTNNVYETGQLTQKTNLTNRDAAAQALMDSLVALAGYVQSVSMGDAAKIQSAGMSVKGARSATQLPEQVGNLAVTAGDNAGELDLQWDSISGAKSYEVQISPDPITATSWIAQPSVTRSKAVILNLASGTRMWLRVRAVNAAGLGAWSDVATKIVP